MGATEDVLADVKKEMEDTVAALRRELARTRTGRASTALLEGIVVEYYGARTPLNQLATLSAPEPRLLVIQPYDRSAINEIERAILQSDLGLVPQNDGKLIRVPIPELTEQRRKDLVKHIRKVAEDFRVSVRNHRRDANDMLKELQKDGEITEDDLRRGQEKTQELTKEYTERLDKILKAKEDEIMEV
jgi:ribosome recycling factor